MNTSVRADFTAKKVIVDIPIGGGMSVSLTYDHQQAHEFAMLIDQAAQAVRDAH